METAVGQTIWICLFWTHTQAVPHPENLTTKKKKKKTVSAYEWAGLSGGGQKGWSQQVL